MIGEGKDFESTADMVTRYLSIDTLPLVEQRILQHPTRAGKFLGPRNALGYRADPFDRRGEFNIASMGCSWVEGSGVAYDEVFAARVKARLEAETGLQIMNWNIGLAAMGMDYLVRIAPAVCNVLRPDLIVIVGTWADRLEHFSRAGKRITFYDPVPELLRMGLLTASDEDRALASAYDGLASEYQDLASHIRAFDSLRGIIEAAGISWAYSWIDMPKASEPIAAMRAAGLLPEDRYLGAHFSRIDYAGAKNKHPGPRSHALFAEAVIGWIKKSGLLDRRVPTRASPLRLWARTLLAGWRGRRGAGTARDEGPDIYPLW
jgi:hypothetical protein